MAPQRRIEPPTAESKAKGESLRCSFCLVPCDLCLRSGAPERNRTSDLSPEPATQQNAHALSRFWLTEPVGQHSSSIGFYREEGHEPKPRQPNRVASYRGPAGF